jgi:hypothetical protein
MFTKALLDKGSTKRTPPETDTKSDAPLPHQGHNHPKLKPQSASPDLTAQTKDFIELEVNSKTITIP